MSKNNILFSDERRWYFCFDCPTISGVRCDSVDEGANSDPPLGQHALEGKMGKFSHAGAKDVGLTSVASRKNVVFYNEILLPPASLWER